jgi:hypothetical protein
MSAPQTAIHFGCWDRVGHFFHDTNGRSLGLDAIRLGLPWDRVDGCLTPGRRDRRGRLDHEAMSMSQQGKASIHHKDGWTALAVHDFTVDSRPGSNTVFFFHADLDQEEVLFSVVEHFPTINRRIGEITVVVDD